MYTCKVGTQTNAHHMCEVGVQCSLPLDWSDYGLHVGDNEDVAETVDDEQYESTDSDSSEESYLYEDSQEQFDKE